MTSDPNAQARAWNERIIADFRAHEGRVGPPFEGVPITLLHTTGARTGAERVTPLIYLEDSGRFVVFASDSGSDRDPDWYRNLLTHADVSLEIGTSTIAARAEAADEPERRRLYDRQAGVYPNYAQYEKKTERVIPVVVLTPSA